MRGDHRIGVVIPALDEEAAIGAVLAEIPVDWVDQVVVVDNGSTDRTAQVARDGGAEVLSQPKRGYGRACKAGIKRCRSLGITIVVFLDGDHSDFPEELPKLVGPIVDGTADFVVGSRMTGERQQGSMAPQQWFGNHLAAWWMRVVWKAPFTDMGPFRAIRTPALHALGMQDDTYGWTLEMQVKAAEAGLRCVEVPVRYRRRIGQSKVTGTIRGTVGASSRILRLMAQFALTRHRRTYPQWRKA